MKAIELLANLDDETMVLSSISGTGCKCLEDLGIKRA